MRLQRKRTDIRVKNWEMSIGDDNVVEPVYANYERRQGERYIYIYACVCIYLQGGLWIIRRK